MSKSRHFTIISALFLVSVILFAFYAVDDAKKDGVDSPGYEIAKHKFYDAYLQYKGNLERGIVVAPPVDPSGYFRVDENGNMNMAKDGNVQSSMFQPKLSSDAVSTYIFTQSTSTYTSINGTGTLVPSSTSCDDDVFGTFPIGFTFTYNGTAQTLFGVCCNGFLSFGAAPAGTYYPLSSNTNMIAPFAYDLQLSATGAIYYQTTGVSPNRVCTVEWYTCGFWPATGNELSFQIKLFETTNAIQVLYTTGTHTSTASLQVGINGNPNTDFANRTTTTNWATTTAGGSNSATCSFSPTIYPASGLTFQWAPPAPPVTPAQIRPLHGAVGRPQNDTIQWGPSGGAANYNLQIATDTTFGTLLYSDTTLTGVQMTIGTFSPLTTYWWRVRAKNGVGWSAFSPGWKFKIKGAASTSTLVTPANNAVNQPITGLISQWRKSVDLNSILAITNYWYELYTDTTLAATIKDSTLTDTVRTTNGLTNNTNYWWRVKAKNEIGWGAFTGYFKFTTVVAIPAAPANIYPLNNAIGIIPTTLIDWSSVAGASQYRLQVSTDSTFTTAQVDTVTSRDSLNVPAGKLLNNVKYYWHVRAENAGGNSAYTGIWNFTTSLVGISNNGLIPLVFKLYDAYPNPFNPVSTIKFDLPKYSDVKIEIFNSIGQSTAILVNSHYEAGSYSLTWDASAMPSGVYFYKITAGSYTDVHKIVLLK